jgi:uncharacterized protein (TIGR02996 family)
MEEEAFLRAISASPDDIALRLVYADWLQEQEDPRAEYVRLEVRLNELPRVDPEYWPLLKQKHKLREELPPYWLAKLDPPVWCVVGNIVDERISSTEDNPRHGTRLFRPHAKIFLSSCRHVYALINPEWYRNESIWVVGQHRKSRKWIQCMVNIRATCNWRIRLIHHPGVMVRLREADWDGFLLKKDDFQPPEQRDTLDAVRALLGAISKVVANPNP